MERTTSSPLLYHAPESPLENDLLATPDAPLFVDDSLDDPAASPVQVEDL